MRTPAPLLHVPARSFYLAARYVRRDELCAYKRDLIERGHQVPARWLLGLHVEERDAQGHVVVSEPDRQREFAREDLLDVMAADVVVNFTEEPHSDKGRGGRHVEFGVALAQRAAGVRHQALFIVGPRENVFHTLDEVDGAFPDWTSFLTFLDTRWGRGAQLLREKYPDFVMGQQRNT